MTLSLHLHNISPMPQESRTLSYIHYGRRRGRPERPHRQELLKTMLSTISVSLENVAARSLDPRSLFPSNTTEIWLEIGYGAGEHLSTLAQRNPKVGFLGCEPFLNGVSRLLRQIETDKLCNVRVLVDDGRKMMEALVPASISRIFVLFPDPWHKRRHHKRRLISTNSVSEFARIMHSGGLLRLATDHDEYCRWSLSHLLANPNFQWTAECANDWLCRPPDWPSTRYERKAIVAGRQPTFLSFSRI